MAELKTKRTNASVEAFLDTIENEQKRKDCKELVKLFTDTTKEKAAMWGESIIGFGSYHYKSERSSQEGDWPITGFSPRKQNISIYLSYGAPQDQVLLKKLGKHKMSKGACLYVNKLEQIDLDVLRELIRGTVEKIKAKYGIE